MKFEISTQEFNYLVSKCFNVVSQKPTIPVLGNILIEAANGKLTLTTTDLTVSIKCSTEANVIEEGATTLPAKRLSQLVRELTSTNIEVYTGPEEITEIKADSSKFRLFGMNKSEYPSFPDLNGAHCFTLKQSEFKDALFRTAFTVSRDETRFVLAGLFLQIENGRATFIGTDGKRLARSYLAIEIDPNFKGKYVLPIKAVDEIIKNIGEDGDLTVYILQDKIAVENEQTIIITKLLSGDYPDVTRVIPSSIQTLIPLHREELSILLRQVALFTTEGNHAARFSFTNGELRLLANTMAVGEGKVSMPVNYQGEKLEIAFNPSFFLDVLRHSKNEVVTLGVSDPFNPGVIADQDLTEFAASKASPLFVLMPMRLNEE